MINQTTHRLKIVFLPKNSTHVSKDHNMFRCPKVFFVLLVVSHRKLQVLGLVSLDFSLSVCNSALPESSSPPRGASAASAVVGAVVVWEVVEKKKSPGDGWFVT